MFKNILVPTDGSDKAIQAAGVAKDIAEKYGARVVLLHVMQPSYGIATFGTVDFIPMPTVSLADITEMDKSVLERTRSVFSESNTTVELRSEWGDPVDGILTVAAEENTDLIVIGNRGMSGIKEFLLGSVSNKLAHEASCPVLIVK